MMSIKSSRKRKATCPIIREDSCTKKRKIDDIYEKLVASKALTAMTPMEMVKFCSPVKKRAEAKGLIIANCQHSSKRVFQRRKKSRKEIYNDVKIALQEWQKEVNVIVKNYDSAPITIVNDVDLEGPPDNFFFINHNKEGPGVTIPKDPIIGCECEDCFESRSSCCAIDSGSEFAYTKKGRLRLPHGTPVYECNMRCKCDMSCPNRVVQKGRRVRVCIFRTANSRGWGVKTLQKIKKGSFVMEYVGEVSS